MTYEVVVRRLNEIVSALSTGSKPLTESLALYEEGVRLLREADQALSAAEETAKSLLAAADPRVD